MSFEILHKSSGKIIASGAHPSEGFAEDLNMCRSAAVQHCAQLGQDLVDADLQGVACPNAD